MVRVPHFQMLRFVRHFLPSLIFPQFSTATFMLAEKLGAQAPIVNRTSTHLF